MGSFYNFNKFNKKGIKMENVVLRLKYGLTDYQLDNLRFKDLTEITDDPGNTKLAVVLFPIFKCEEHRDNEGLDYYEYTKSRVNFWERYLKVEFDSRGDHAEEVKVLTMNNDVVLVFNFNK
jgi:hypothetical protein